MKTCASCGAGIPGLDGRCPACGSAAAAAPREIKCARCSAPVVPGEKFCGSCGGEVQSPAQRMRARHESAERQERIGRARKWLLAVSILTFITGIVFYFIQKEAVEKQHRDAERQMEGMDPAERDARLKTVIGMTWEEAVAHDRGAVRLLLYINLGLGGVYLLLWRWALSNAFAAALVALLLFVTVHVVNAIVEPKSLAQGWLVKIFFTAALLKALNAAYQERQISRAER